MLRSLCLVVPIVLLSALPAAALDTVFENFDTDPFWSSLNASAVNDDYGYSGSTNNSGGSTGEAGGLFGRHDAFDSYYADTDLGGTLLAGSDALHSSGRISINNSGGGSFPANISFFEQTNSSKGGNALRINIEPNGNFILWLRLEIGKNLVSPTSTGLVDGQYTWTMDWDPTGSPDGLGQGVVTFNGVSPGTPSSVNAVLDIPMRNEPGNPEWLQETIPFNAFGLQNYDGEATTSGQFAVHIDDVSYSVVSAPSTSSTWDELAGGTWTNSFHWSPGEVPFGNDRTAIFSDSVVQNSSVVVDRDVTVKHIQFDNSTFRYALVGSHTLHLSADSGKALLSVLSGHHNLQTRVSLESTTEVTTAANASLTFNSALALNGRTLEITAGSRVNFNNLGDEASSGFVMNSGVLGGGGRVNGSVSNLSGATVGPGNSVDTLRVDGSFSQEAGGTLEIEIAGEDSADLLAASGTATLDGTVSIELLDGYLPSGGETFTVLTATAGITDLGLSLTGADSNRFRMEVLSGTNLVLTARLPGDYNDDGTVNAADYLVWLETLGSSDDLRADGDFGGSVGLEDYFVFKSQIGKSENQGAASHDQSPIPEPTALGLLTVGIAVGLARLRLMKLGSFHLSVAAVLWCLVGTAAPVSAELVGNNFRTDPLWQGDDNVLPQGDPNKERDDFNNFRYRPDTNNAFGNPGEVGGYLGMNTFDAFYADTTLGGNVGGSFPLQQSLHAGGRLMVNSDHGPTWNMNIGFFDQNDYTDVTPGVGEGLESGSGDAVRIAIIEQSPDFRLRLEIRQQGNGYNGPVLSGANGLLDGMYTWSLDYDPSGGAGTDGRLSLKMYGPTVIDTFVDVDSAGKNIAMNLDSFGFTNYNSGTSRPDFNKHYAFLDDLAYSTNESADLEVAWDRPGHGSWTEASSWRGTSRTDGAGFVPDGADRTAVFGTGLTQDAVVVIDDDVTTKRIEFDNDSQQYSIAGTANIVLDDEANTQADIEVHSGHHQFLAALRLEDDTTATAAPGTVLDFNNAIDLNGHTLTLAGDGEINLLNRVITGNGGLVANAGLLGGSGWIDGDLANTGTLTAEPGTAGLSVTGIAELSGTLDVDPADDLAPGATFTVLQAGQIVDRGLSLLPDAAPLYDLIIGENSVVVQVAIPEPSSLLLLVGFLSSLLTGVRNLKAVYWRA